MNVNKTLQHCAQTMEAEELFQAMRPYQEENLSPKTLAKCFETLAQPVEGKSDWITIPDLIQANKSYQSNNGCQWARSDQGYLSKRYKVERKHEGGRVSAVRLNGYV